MTTLFPIPATPQLPILGSDLSFPVRRIYCVGRNYAAHAKEMGHFGSGVVEAKICSEEGLPQQYGQVDSVD